MGKVCTHEPSIAIEVTVAFYGNEIDEFPLGVLLEVMDVLLFVGFHIGEDLQVQPDRGELPVYSPAVELLDELSVPLGLQLVVVNHLNLPPNYYQTLFKQRCYHKQS